VTWRTRPVVGRVTAPCNRIGLATKDWHGARVSLPSQQRLITLAVESQLRSCVIALYKCSTYLLTYLYEEPNNVTQHLLVVHRLTTIVQISFVIDIVSYFERRKHAK